MATQAIKISELPSSQSFTGLFTIGVQGGQSVKIDLSELADNANVLAAAQAVMQQIRDYNGIARPISMTLPAEHYVPIGGESDIPAVLSPAAAMKNFVYQVRSGSAVVTPDGHISVSESGTTVVWVIPVENVALWKETHIVGYVQAIVVVRTRTGGLRLTSFGAIRLT